MALTAFLILVPAAGVAQEPAELSIAPAWSTDRFLGGRATVELELSRPLAPGRERLALVIGALDVSALLTIDGARVRYRPVAARLPSGESEVAAYLVAADGSWRELGRAPLRVLSPSGLESGQLIPNVDLTSTGQLDRSLAPGEPAPDRLTYQDVTARIGIQGRAARSGWALRGQANAIGVTERTHRLRFGELAEAAPVVDLSDYQLQVERGRARVSLGNVTAGANRFLLNGFGSRGLAAAVGLGSVATVDAALVNGTNVVGWANLLGLARSAHRIGAATLSLELAPSRPGGMRIAVTGMEGSVLPLTSFTQAAATDAEESRGLGVQVTLSDARDRVRFAGGLSRSRFRNPADPLLARDTAIVPVEPTTRTARFGELAVQLAQGTRIAGSVAASLGVALRHEQVDPLYRSVGAFVQSDQRSDGVDLTGTLGALSFQGSLGRSRDNLGEIASVLTSITRTRGLGAALPLASLVGAPRGAWYLPAVTWAWQSTHQLGEGIPVGGDFSASHVPDQRSTNQSAGLAWSTGGWSLAYRWNQSFQDNRQPGRDRADFRGIVHGLSLGLTPAPALSANVDVSVERQKAFETGDTQRLERLGAGLRWQPFRHTGVVGSLSRSWGLDPFTDRRTRNTEHQIELSQGFTLYRRVDYGSQGRLFLRYARTRAAVVALDPAAFLAPRITWALNAGASLRLY